MKHGIRSFSYIIFYPSFFRSRFLNLTEIVQRLTADFYNFTDVDGICSSLTRLEADRDETDFPVKIRSEGSQQCVRQIVVFRHQRQILGHVVCFHQTERGICIRHGYVEIGQSTAHSTFSTTAREKPSPRLVRFPKMAS